MRKTIENVIVRLKDESELVQKEAEKVKSFIEYISNENRRFGCFGNHIRALRKLYQN